MRKGTVADKVRLLLKERKSPMMLTEICEVLGFENYNSARVALQADRYKHVFNFTAKNGVHIVSLRDERTLEEKVMEQARQEMNLPVQAVVRTNAKVCVASEADYEAIGSRIESKFNTLILHIQKGILTNPTKNCLIVYGAASIGKSHAIQQAIEGNGITKFGEKLKESTLYEWLYDNPNGVLFLDDCTNLYDRDVIRILKVATMKEGDRIITIPKGSQIGGRENQFQFHGSIIIASNNDFGRKANGNSDTAKDVNAIVKRSITMDMGCYEKDEAFARMIQISESMDHGLSKSDFKKVMKVVFEHRNSEWLIDPDARILNTICGDFADYGEDWIGVFTDTYLK